LLFLVGFMGSGKSTVGPLIAKKLGWEFLDLDEMIVQQQHRSIDAIFKKDGEAAFRACETAALEQRLQQVSQPGIIALGGGAFSRAENREAIQRSGALVAWLDAPVHELLLRCRNQKGGAARPLLSDEAQFRKLYDQRRSDYNLASRRFETAGAEPTEIAARIADWIKTVSLGGSRA
jgi:shikimate kinase